MFCITLSASCPKSNQQISVILKYFVHIHLHTSNSKCLVYPASTTKWMADDLNFVNIFIICNRYCVQTTAHKNRMASWAYPCLSGVPTTTFLLTICSTFSSRYLVRTLTISNLLSMESRRRHIALLMLNKICWNKSNFF